MRPKYDCAAAAAASRKDGDISNLNAKLESEQNLVAQLQKKIKELQVNAEQGQLLCYLLCFGILQRPTALVTKSLPGHNFDVDVLNTGSNLKLIR